MIQKLEYESDDFKQKLSDLQAKQYDLVVKNQELEKTKTILQNQS